jgi:hypothetical protein
MRPNHTPPPGRPTAATSFFKEEGFAVERFKQIDFVPEMRSRVFEPQVLERIEYEEVWVMRLIN